MTETPFLPYGRQTIDEDDISAVAEVLRGPTLTGGPEVAAFERALCDVTGAAYAVACANGTAALHLCATALNIGPGDRVIVPTVTFLATANAARYVGAEVVFADVDPDTGLMTPDTLAAAVSRAGGSAAAVFNVHLNGQSGDIDGLLSVCDGVGAPLVNDSCHALGGRMRIGGEWTAIGSGRGERLASFSFHPVKTIAMGEGGAVTTNDADLATRMARLRNHGMTREAGAFQIAEQAFDKNGVANPWYYEMAEIGWNYRASDIHCALGRSQLAKLPRFVEKRRSLAAQYDVLLAEFSPHVIPVGRTDACDPAWHLYVVLIDFNTLGVQRGDVMRGLRDPGVGAQVHYLPVHRQPYYRERVGDLDLPGADAYYARALSLPLFPAMDKADPARVVAALGRALGV